MKAKVEARETTKEHDNLDAMPVCFAGALIA
jgi:hypothetical protein